MTPLNLGFRIEGPTTNARRLVIWAAAFDAYACCDAKVDLRAEAFLSAFAFGNDLYQREDSWKNLNMRGFEGPCWSPFIWWDIDREGELATAANDTGKLIDSLTKEFSIIETELLIFFSGSKGFHIGLPTSLWGPEPGLLYNLVAREFAGRMAASAAVKIDATIYDKVRPFRAPNSRHPKTGLHKVSLSLREVRELSPEAIRDLAKTPHPFPLLEPGRTSQRAVSIWTATQEAVTRTYVEMAAKKAASDFVPRLNRSTREFICEGAPEGERSNRLYAAAANLADFNCPPALAHAILTEPALDSGLPPAEVRRQIDCGLNRKGNA